jgi:hypothetical protein
MRSRFKPCDSVAAIMRKEEDVVDLQESLPTRQPHTLQVAEHGDVSELGVHLTHP